MMISVVVPCHNEADNISRLIKKIEDTVRLPHELVIVDDHSTDKTAELVNQLSQQYKNIVLIENKSCKGFANALKAGFAACKTDIIIPVMGDLCDDLQTIEQMYDKINQGYDIVCGSRYCNSGVRSGGSKIKGFLSSWAGRSLYWLLGIPTHDIANAFKMYRKKVIESMPLESTGFEISMEIPLKAYYLGFRITEVPTVWRERTQGKSSFKVLKLLPRYLKLYFRALLQFIVRTGASPVPTISRGLTSKNILVIRNDRFGEFLLTIPTLRALKDRFNYARITAVVDPYVDELAKCVPYIDQTILWERKKHSFLEKIKMIRLLRKMKFDIAVMLNPSKEFNILTFLSGIPVRAGYKRKWGFLLTEAIEDRKGLGDKHEIEYNLELVGILGAKAGNKELFLNLDKGITNEFLQKFNVRDNDFLIAVHPWTSDPVKQWPVENFRCLIQMIATNNPLTLSSLPEAPTLRSGQGERVGVRGFNNVKIIIIGGKEDTAISNRYFSNIADSVLNLTGKTSLVQLAGILGKCKLLISGDSGPVHLACCVQTKVLAIFRNDIPGKTAKRWGPWGQGHVIIEKANLSDITVDEVFIKLCQIMQLS